MKFCITCGIEKKSDKGIYCRPCAMTAVNSNPIRAIKISNSLMGHTTSPEVKEKIRQSAKNRLSNKENHPMYGKTHTDETKQKIRSSVSGDKNPKWKGGRIKTKNGYVNVYAPDNSMSNIDGYVAEHRLVMGEKIGRPLEKYEIVHHINEVRDDNRIENLELTTPSDHIANHNSRRVWKEESKQKHRDKVKKLKRNALGRFINNGVLPTQMIPGAAVPFIDLTKSKN